MQILLIGLGSIGKRHLRNILGLGFTGISVVSRSGVLPAEFSSLPVFKSIEAALERQQWDTAVLCNPTAQHINTLQILVAAGVKNIYLEKPVSHTWEGVAQMGRVFKSSSSNVKVGYDLRFDPGLIKVKELLQNDVIGKVVSVNAQVGQYLPDWRPHEDYRKGMSARKETGGGVMLDLVHEFDYLYWLLGNVETVACHYFNSGALNIETEDVAEVLLRFKSGTIGTIHLDYLQQELVRNCMITGYKGSIFWDLGKSRVEWIKSNKEKETFEYVGFERNDRFISAMSSFLYNRKDGTLPSFPEASESLKMVLAAKYSSDHNTFVNLDDFTKTALGE